MLCNYGCGKEANYQLNNGKWCCEQTHYHCPEMKKKFLTSREKVECPSCGKLISKNTLSKHLTVCRASFCKKCGKAINSNKKFCNSSCAASYNNLHREKKTKVKAKCTICKNKTDNPLYCSIGCASLGKKKATWEKIKTGNCNQTNTIRKHFIEHFGNKCWVCGTDEWCGRPVPLVLDHVDGNPYNNDFDNFRLVCGNCDMQLPTYKSKNMGRGRHERRKRYNEGKSY